MVKNINPFIVSGKIAPEYFCDRVKEAADLEKSIHNQMNVVLTSPRRMGKTALVDFVFDKSEIKDEYVTVSVVLTSVPSSAGLSTSMVVANPVITTSSVDMLWEKSDDK